jgi:hypothetical protein
MLWSFIYNDNYRVNIFVWIFYKNILLRRNLDLQRQLKQEDFAKARLAKARLAKARLAKARLVPSRCVPSRCVPSRCVPLPSR